MWRYWGRPLTKIFGKAPRGAILFDDAESAKRIATVEGIARELVRAGADRRAVIVAVGGGVVGDVAGFAAATYLRGVRLVHIPTTLVAQVDSAIGGKTGVDLPEGKNLVGAFYPPRLVIADPATLATLPHREFRAGLYEVIKYGVIADAKLFDFLERRMDAILRRDPRALGWIISRSAAIKARVVSEDEREGGLRQILNFGHTLGHALETATGYKRFLHGEAVGWGMLGATLLAVGTGRLARVGCRADYPACCERGAAAIARKDSRRRSFARFSRAIRRRARAAFAGFCRAASAAPGGESRFRGGSFRILSPRCRRLRAMRACARNRLADSCQLTFR